MPLDCAAAPCGSCPYRLDHPSGVWHREEYEKLREYTPEGDAVPALSTFLCHQTNATGKETICRGWLSVESDSIAVRLLILRGLSPVTVYAEPPVPLHESGAAAAAAGLAQIDAPTPEAVKMGKALIRKGAAKR